MDINNMYEVQIRHLHKAYGNHVVFDNLNINIEKGKITAILGPSGCGKTTLLNIIGGIEKEYTGEVIIGERSLSYIFQEDRLIQSLSVLENVAFVLKSTMNKDEANKVASEYLNIVKLLDYKDLYPSQLSGGMKRRTAIARALAYKSKILLMDEPFKGLDINLKDDIIEKFLKIQNEEKRTVIFVTHDLNEARMLSDEVFTLNEN